MKAQTAAAIASAEEIFDMTSLIALMIPAWSRTKSPTALLRDFTALPTALTARWNRPGLCGASLQASDSTRAQRPAESWTWPRSVWARCTAPSYWPLATCCGEGGAGAVLPEGSGEASGWAVGVVATALCCAASRSSARAVVWKPSSSRLKVDSARPAAW